MESDEVIRKVRERLPFPVEASGRHVHLCARDVDVLFGHRLNAKRDLSQPGQFQAEERVTIAGPKGTLERVSVLGPERAATQAEISATDALSIGVPPIVRESGDVKGSSGGVRIIGTAGEVLLKEGVIVAKRHIHLTPADAALLGVKNGEEVSVRVRGTRPLVFESVSVRVSEKFDTAMHIDYDEANACGFVPGTEGTLVLS